MAETAPRMPLSQDEAAALGLAVLAHVGLVAALVYLKPADVPPPPPERMEVTISDETGLVSTSPDPQADPAADSGPIVGDMVPPPVPEPVEVAKAEVQPRPAIVPPRPAPAPAPRQLVQPKPQPQVKPAQPQAKSAQPQVKQVVRNPAPPRPGTRPGNSRFDNAFGDGVPLGNPGANNQITSAATFGPSELADLQAAIRRQIKPHWVAPQGLDAEKLVTKVRFNLDRNGRLVGEPVMVSQETRPSNLPQAKRHFEQAVRAIKLVRQFQLPVEFYSKWQTLTVVFDRRLSQ